MQAEAGQSHVAWLGGYIESAQDQSQLTGMLRLYPRRDSTQEEALQTLVSEPEYGHAAIVTRNVTGYNAQLLTEMVYQVFIRNDFNGIYYGNATPVKFD